MDRQATRNAWRLFNLRESPFFQEPLQAGTRFPMSLFVGRTADTNRLLNKIARSPGSSRQTVRGAIGVGKSTLAQHLKAEVVQDGILSTPAPVSVSSALTVDQLCALVLRSVLDALVGTTPQKPAVQKAILVHFNNLENLTEANAERAAALLRDIRDLCFMADGFHWLIVGTEDAVRTVIDAQPQLATVFSTPPALAPLSEAQRRSAGHPVHHCGCG